MSVSFTRLKITGFKSFSDPISLDILPGLTGIIGPNGCGKSNIVEAIRWVMGESSAKSLRGGEMDDVIFAGTVRRAARNIAEVALTLDGTENIAPPPFQQQDQLQISRQIERGSGSQYRMNGKVQRARDIQTFFADLGSGPRSSAIISQNRIAQLISASPEERRQVLEEAAGIAGLYSRRREAELKLKATEENLARLDDLRQQLSELIFSLTEQSAQASTYRSLSSALRETETNLQCLYFQRALKNIDLCTQKVITSEQTQHEIQQQLKKNQLALENIENILPKTRQQETQTRIEWEQKRYQVKNLKEEEDRLNQQIVQLQERVKEADLTYQAANTRLNNTKQDLNNYQEQFDKTVSEIEQHPEKEQQSNDKIQQLKEKNEVLTRNLQEAEEILRQKNIKINEITQSYHQAKQKKETLEEEYHILSVEYETCLQHLPKKETLQTLLQEQQNAQTNLAQITIEQKQLEDQINQEKLNLSERQYHLKHVQEKYTQLNQQIKQTIQNLANIKHEQDTLNAQSINLQNQCHSQDELSQLTIKIEQLQTTLDQAKITAEQALFTHQDSIKKRLEQEASYSEAKRLYETRQQTLTSAKQSFTQSKNRLETLSRQVDQAKNNLIDKKEVETAEHSFNLQKTGKDTLFTQLNTLKESFQVEQTNLENAKASLSQHDHQIQRLEAKRDGLSQALSHDQDENHDKDALLPAIAETISIPEEWIATIAAIFDETLELPESTEGKTGWSILPEIDSDFPEYVIKLSSIIPPSPPLQRIFNAIGIVDHFYDGEELFSQLQAGQILVTRQGDIWRWDGYHQKAGKQTKAAQRLLQRQVLKQTEQELEELWKITPVLEQNLTLVEETYTNLSSALNQTQNNYQAQEKSYQQAQQTFIILQNKAHAAQSNFDAVHPSFLQAQEEFTEKELYLQNAEKEATLPKPDTAMVERHKQQEQEYQQEAQKAHQLLKAIEHQFDQAKEQKQKALNINQQNHIRLEALKEKITHLDDDHKKQILCEQDLKQQLQQVEQPQHAQNELAKVQKQVENLQNTLKEKNTAYQTIEQALQSTQQTYQQLKEKFIQQNSRLETLTPKRDTAKKLLDDAVVIFQNAEKTYENCPVTTLENEQLRDLHNELTRSKEQEEQERLAHHLLLNQKETLFKEKETLIVQIRDWEARLTQTDQETANTQSKLKVLQEELSSLTEKPILIKEKIIHLEQLEQETSNLYLQAQQQLNTLEQQRQDAQKALQQAEQNAIKIRENLLKAQAKQEQAEALLEQLKNNIPPDIQIIAQQPSESELDLSDQTERKLKTTILELTTERDALGAVNLRAEIEREEKQTTLTIIEKEYADLATAIQQLRDSIQKLNQQGKEKLNAIFSEVDQHFQELFTRMFNGGHAYLKLLAHEDPLQCGLEIYVQPPGKKLSTLSLLSGGEQALTALSLVFAVSRCNPVPICVLDEVDAPLDDPNVERFCTLLSDMTEQAGTRFLVVTHHQLTMSHMHRLYGVTMQERGVSQIISIDLEHAVQMQQDKHEAQPGLI